MVFPEAVVEEVEAEADELETLETAQLRTRGKSLGVAPVGDKRKAEVWRQALQAARAAVQEAAAVAATAAAAATHASAASATAGLLPWPRSLAGALLPEKRGDLRALETPFPPLKLPQTTDLLAFG
jgi:hypothetical protein